MISKKTLLIAITITQLMGFSTFAVSKALPCQNTQNITVRTCPADSISITTDLPGVTDNTQCKKLAGVRTNTSDLPVNGSSIGNTWGVVDENKTWKYVPAIVTIEKQCSTSIEP
jgi:hypothetical protein